MATTLNHLKKGESLANKQLVIVSSDGRDDPNQGTTSFTYTFDQAVERVSKIDVMYTKIPKTYYNVNDDNATMTIATQTFTETKTDSLVLDDSEIKEGAIKATNIVDGTVIKQNLFSSSQDAVINQVYPKKTSLYSVGHFSDIINFHDFTGQNTNTTLQSGGKNDIFISKFKLDQTLDLRFKISGSNEEILPRVISNDTDLFITGLFNSINLDFFNADNTRSTDNLLSDGNYNTFICRYSQEGVFQWRLKITGIPDSTIEPLIILDDVNNFIYVTSTYTSSELIFYNPDDTIALSETGLTPDRRTYVVKYDFDGNFIWRTKIRPNCYPTTAILNPNTSGIMVGLVYEQNVTSTGIEFVNSNNTVVGALSLDGISNLAIVEFSTSGFLSKRFKIAGTNIDNDISIDINGSDLAILGKFNSSPVKFYNTYDIPSSLTNLNNPSITSDLFIAKYNIDKLLNNMELVWAYLISSDKEAKMSNVSFSSDGGINISGMYTSTLKFYDSTGLIIGKDLLNTTGISYGFLAKYKTDGKFDFRSKIEGTGGVTINNINSSFNDTYISLSASATSITLFNSDDTVNNTVTGIVGIDSFMISYTNNINDFQIDVTTLDHLILCRNLLGDNINYALILNSFSQSLGFTKSQRFRALSIGTAITWTELNITNANKDLVILFHVANPDTQQFDDTIITFTIPTLATYNPFNLAFELSNIIIGQIATLSNFTYNQSFKPVVYNDNKKVFYLQLIMDGTFTVQSNQLAIDMNLSLTESHHCVIADKPISETGTDITFTDGTKISLKLSEETSENLFTDVPFTTALSNIASGSGNMFINSANIGININSRVGATGDDISADLQVNDKITFDSPWRIQSSIGDNVLSNNSWTSCSISNDNIYALITGEFLQLYITDDGGETWKAKESRRDWVECDISSNGNYMVAIANNSRIFISDDSGDSWTPKDSVREWTGIAMSSDGQYISACANLDGLFISNDFGDTWVKRGENLQWRGISMDSTGRYQLVAVDGGQLYNSIDFGETWNVIPTSPTLPWYKTQISSFNIRMFAIQTGSDNIHVSADSGTTWGTTGPSLEWTGIRIFGVGQYMIGCTNNNPLYRFSNYGSVWVQAEINRPWTDTYMSRVSNDVTLSVTSDGTVLITKRNLSGESDRYEPMISKRLWRGVSISLDGTYQTGVAFQDRVFVSNDSGNTWTAILTIFDQPWSCVSISATGEIQLGLNKEGYVGGATYVSTDFGANWSLSHSSSGPSCAISSDGKVMIVGTGFYEGDGYAVSTDTGTNWTSYSIANTGKATAVSSFGDYMLIAKGSKMSVSTDFGVTFTEFADATINGTTRTWTGSDLSGNGQIMVACNDDTSDGFTYVSTDFGNTWTKGTIDAAWVSIRISDDGNTIVAINTPSTDFATKVGIYVSSDNGATWINSAPIQEWTSVSISSNGNVITAVGERTNVYRSFNKGQTWINTELFPASEDEVISTSLYTDISADGSAQIVVWGTDDENRGKALLSLDTGLTWNNIFPPTPPGDRPYSAVAIDGTGNTILVATQGIVYSSTNGGAVWATSVTFLGFIRGIAITSTASVQYIATSSGLYTSNDFINWSHVNVAPISFQSLDGVVVSSPFAQHIYARKSFGVYVSNDSGASWAETFTGNTEDIACSTDGKYVVVTTSSPNIQFSSDNGANWSPISTSATVNETSVCSISGDGSTIVLCGSRTFQSVTISQDFGATWRKIGVLTTGWLDASSSENSLVHSFLGQNLTAYISVDGGDTFTNRPLNPNANISGYTISNDGIYRTIVFDKDIVNISNDSGATWSERSERAEFRDVAMSLDGSVQMAVSLLGSSIGSSDFGVTWTSEPLGVSTAVSGDGNVRVIGSVGDNSLLISTGGGAFNSTGPAGGTYEWTSVAASNDGTKMIAANNPGTNVWVTTNTGTLWSSVGIPLGPPGYRNVDISGDGAIMMATADAVGPIYISTNSGLNWNTFGPSFVWNDISMSNDGTIMTAVTSDDFIYSSTDSGVTWVTTGTVEEYLHTKVSGNGLIQVTATSDTLYNHPFPLNSEIELNVLSIVHDDDVLDKAVYKELTDNTTKGLDGFNMADGLNYSIIRNTPSNPVDIFVPPGDYTPATLVAKINELIEAIEPTYTEAFTYDVATKKISFKPFVSGSDVIVLTDLLENMGFSSVPSISTAGETIKAQGVVNRDMSGPLNIYIKSDIIGDLRKRKTPFSTNKQLENLIAPLELHKETNTFRVPIVVEVFLSKKETIQTVDIQIVDEKGNIVNLNGGTVQVNFYFYSS